MADYSKLSDQELLSKINGGSNSQSSDLSSISDEELLSKINSQDEFQQEAMPPEPSNQSPLDLKDQLRFGFADDRGKEELLREKFNFVKKDEQGNYLVGEDPGNLQTLIPDGIVSDIPGKIARHIGDINVIAGSIIGAGSGAFGAGPVGAMAGSAAGAGAGEALNKFIGKSMGVNSEDPKEMATDIVISSAFGAAGEGANQLILKAGQKALPAGLNLLTKALGSKSPEEKPAAVKAVAKLLNFSSGVKEDSVLTAIEYGAENVLARGNGSDKQLQSIMSSVGNKFKEKEVQYGQMLGKAKQQLATKVRTPQPTAELQSNIYSSMQELGLIDKYGVINKDMTGEQKSLYNKFAPLFKQLGGVEDKAIPTFSSKDEFLGNVRNLRIDPQAKQPVSKLFQIDNAARMSMDSEIDTQAGKNFYNLVYGNQNARYGKPVKGIANLFDDLSQQAGVPALREANAAMASVKGLKEAFRKAGIDISNSRSLENFIKSGGNDSVVVKDLIQQADGIFNSNFTRDIRIFDAAKDMTKIEPHFFRFGIIAGILGLNYLRQPGVGNAAYLGAALLGGTPFGAGLALRAGTKVGPAIARAGTLASRSTRVGSQTLSRLIKTKENSQSKQEPQKKSPQRYQ